MPGPRSSRASILRELHQTQSKLAAAEQRQADQIPAKQEADRRFRLAEQRVERARMELHQALEAINDARGERYRARQAHDRATKLVTRLRERATQLQAQLAPPGDEHQHDEGPPIPHG